MSREPLRRLRTRLVEAVGLSVEDEFQLARQVQFGKYRIQVVANGGFGQAQSFSYFFPIYTSPHKGHDLAFTRCQSGDSGAVGIAARR